MTKLTALILQESNWLPLSMVLAACIAMLARLRTMRPNATRSELARMLNLFYGSLIGIMAIGHLSAVSIKLANGTLRGSVPVLYTIGLALFIPAWWLVFTSLRDLDRYHRSIIGLNAALGVSLLAIGVANIPLAVPAFLNIAYQRHTTPSVGLRLVRFTLLLYSALFVGGAIFLASGKSFEEFGRMR